MTLSHRRMWTPGKWAGRVSVQSAVLLVVMYQGLVRPFLVGTCRYCPSCSEYAIEALRRHGVLRGVRLTASRLLRCRPFARGGYDPVPGADRFSRTPS